MSQRDQYAPKHRAPVSVGKHRAPVSPGLATSASRTMLRTTVLFSSIAVAATAGVVSTGVVSTPQGVTAAAGSLHRASQELTERDLDERATTVSRTDRRDEADPAKEATLAQQDGPAVTRTEDLSQSDPRDIGRALLAEFGFSSDQFGCLDSLWTKESNWSVTADNPTSSAYGIPQALPGSKMASAGGDWATNPVTQIRWGLGYIQDRYGSPCAAWGKSQSVGWY